MNFVYGNETGDGIVDIIFIPTIHLYVDMRYRKWWVLEFKWLNFYFGITTAGGSDEKVS